MEFTAAATWLNTAFAGFDNAILEFMHRLEEAAGGFVTPLAKFVTLIGEKGLWMFALAFALMLFARTRKLGICLFGAVCCGALITNIILKDLIARPRPFEAMAPFLKYWKAVGSPAEDGFSFPSGHVTAAAAGMSAIMFVKGRKWILPAAGYVFLMCFSRNYLMAHYPSDVLAASLVGLISGLVAYLIGSFIWEYIDDNDDLPFFRTLRHFSLPLPDISGVTKKLNRVPSRSADKKADRKAAKAAKESAPRGRHSAAEAQGRHSAPRHAARAAEPDFELDQFDEDIDMKLDESLEDEVKQGLQAEDADDYETVIRASRRGEDSGTHAAVDTGRHAAATGRHQAVSAKRSSTGVFEATGRILRAERTGSHEAVRTGSHEAVRTGSHEAVRTGRHAAAPAADKKSAGKNAKAGLSKAAAGFGGMVSAAKSKMPAVKAPAALKWRAEQRAAEQAAEATGPVAAPEAPAKSAAPAAAKAARPTSDWNARWEEYQARKERAQVKTAPAAPGSSQMEFENRFAGDEDMKIVPESGAKEPVELRQGADEAPAAPAAEAVSEEKPEAPAEAVKTEAMEEEKLLSPRKPAVAEDEKPAEPAPGAIFAPPPVKAEPAPVELDMSEFYSMLDGSYDFSRD